MPKTTPKDYATLSMELDDVLAKLQAPDVSVDEAVALYERGLELARTMEKALVSTELKLQKLKLKDTGKEK